MFPPTLLFYQKKKKKYPTIFEDTYVRCAEAYLSLRPPPPFFYVSPTPIPPLSFVPLKKRKHSAQKKKLKKIWGHFFFVSENLRTVFCRLFIHDVDRLSKAFLASFFFFFGRVSVPASHEALCTINFTFFWLYHSGFRNKRKKKYHRVG